MQYQPPPPTMQCGHIPLTYVPVCYGCRLQSRPVSLPFVECTSGPTATPDALQPDEGGVNSQYSIQVQYIHGKQLWDLIVVFNLFVVFCCKKELSFVIPDINSDKLLTHTHTCPHHTTPTHSHTTPHPPVPTSSVH